MDRRAVTVLARQGLQDPLRPYDRLGRKQPHGLDFASFARGIPGFAEQFGKRVPKRYLRKSATGVWTVTCVCAARHELRPLHLRPCDCGRVFVLLGDMVKVAGGA